MEIIFFQGVGLFTIGINYADRVLHVVTSSSMISHSDNFQVSIDLVPGPGGSDTFPGQFDSESVSK